MVQNEDKQVIDLLTNAIESIQLGVEDFQKQNHPRLLSAVRNIHAGILLLYKEALRRLSPEGSDEVLVKSKIVPKRNDDGDIKFVGSGKYTVNIEQIRERFAGLRISTDWTRFDRITAVRNDIEHYYPKTNRKALDGVITDAFIIIRDFVATQLHEDPGELLGEGTWNVMLEVADIYTAERNECDKALQAVDWGSGALEEGVYQLTCPKCSSDLLRPAGDRTRYDEITLCCRACGNEKSPELFVPEAIKVALARAMYLVYADGNELPYTDCPECGTESYVIEEDQCALCECEAEHTCRRCFQPIVPAELMCSPYCGYCAHVWSKD